MHIYITRVLFTCTIYITESIQTYTKTYLYNLQGLSYLKVLYQGRRQAYYLMSTRGNRYKTARESPQRGDSRKVRQHNAHVEI